MPDGCNGSEQCGDCQGLKGCGEGGKANVCGTFFEQCSTTNFAGAACVLVNGSTTEHRYCQPSLIQQYGARHTCITFGSVACQNANSSYRCDF
jgi:hypothetical protein